MTENEVGQNEINYLAGKIANLLEESDLDMSLTSIVDLKATKSKPALSSLSLNVVLRSSFFIISSFFMRSLAILTAV